MYSGRAAGEHMERHLKSAELIAFGKTCCHCRYCNATRMFSLARLQGLISVSQGVSASRPGSTLGFRGDEVSPSKALGVFEVDCLRRDIEELAELGLKVCPTSSGGPVSSSVAVIVRMSIGCVG